MTFSKSSFTSNKASKTGGAIYASSFSNFLVKDGCTFSSNFADSNGDDMYIVNTENQFSLINSTIDNPVGKNSIYASQITL